MFADPSAQKTVCSINGQTKKYEDEAEASCFYLFLTEQYKMCTYPLRLHPIQYILILYITSSLPGKDRIR